MGGVRVGRCQVVAPDRGGAGGAGEGATWGMLSQDVV